MLLRPNCETYFMFPSKKFWASTLNEGMLLSFVNTEILIRVSYWDSTVQIIDLIFVIKSSFWLISWFQSKNLWTSPLKKGRAPIFGYEYWNIKNIGIVLRWHCSSFWADFVYGIYFVLNGEGIWLDKETFCKKPSPYTQYWSHNLQPINSHISVYIREKGSTQGGGWRVCTIKIYPKTKFPAKYEVKIS